MSSASSFSNIAAVNWCSTAALFMIARSLDFRMCVNQHPTCGRQLQPAFRQRMRSSCFVVDRLLQAQNRANDQFISHSRVEHRVVYGTVWPFHLEVFLNKCRSLLVNDVHLLFGFLLTDAVADEAADFFI